MKKNEVETNVSSTKLKSLLFNTTYDENKKSRVIKIMTALLLTELVDGVLPKVFSLKFIEGLDVERVRKLLEKILLTSMSNNKQVETTINVLSQVDKNFDLIHDNFKNSLLYCDLIKEAGISIIEYKHSYYKNN